MQMYVQCRLTKGSVLHRIVWMRVDTAVKGVVIQTQKNDGTWDGPWEITNVQVNSKTPVERLQASERLNHFILDTDRFRLYQKNESPKAYSSLAIV